MPKVYNIRWKTHPRDAKYVGRNTQWGNPYIIGVDGDRDEVCDLFLEYAINKNSTNPNWLKPLRGSDLVCHCKPKRCHADTLLILANDVPE